ncbi:uncharacterized protein [Nicotiana sylvestris]|uniref:uncharacterized protein n=1 Tax=Nicotiana sylvestris TaxID=4096 RepID=UPI00388C5B82
MVAFEMLKNGFVPGKGLGASLLGIIQPVSLPENSSMFGLRFKPTTADVKRDKRMKQKVWALSKPVLRLSKFFVKPGARKHLVTTVPNYVVDIDDELIERLQRLFDDVNMVEIGEGSSKEGMQFVETNVKLNNWKATPLPTRKESWEEIIKELFEYIDIVAWSYDDMPGLSIDLVVHKLPIDPAFPLIKQKLRRFKTDMSVKIKEEITKQLDAKVIRVMRYPTWLSNVVPMPKKDVSRRAIVLDPSKIKAIQELPPPRNKTEVMNLLGRLNNISRFIAQLTTTCEPIFKLLKKDVVAKWIDECQEACDKIKGYLSNPLVLVPPELGRPLIHYLTVLDNSFGCVLGQHDITSWKEQAIYYLSKKFTSYEVKYTPLERTCCALTWVAQKLKHYLSSYTTYLISRLDPLKYISQKPMPIGRLAKWQILLTEFDIVYVTWTVMKAQALADHLAENPVDEEYEPLSTYFPNEEVIHIDEVKKDENPGWKLLFDGAANMKGVGIGAVLISEIGHHNPVTAQLRFYCTNNMVEYEACILGLRLAIDMGIQEVLILGDSNLLVHHIQGEWETRDLKLIPYRQCLHDLCKRFRSIEFRHIPRIHNEVDDALATLASMLHHPDKAYVDPLHIQFGIPKVIITDYGDNLNSHLMKQVCQQFKIMHRNSTLYCPKENGAVEAANKNTKKILQKIVQGSSQWHEKLPFALLGYRTTVRTSVGATPYLLVYVTEAVIPAGVEISSLRIVAEAGIDDDEWVKTRLEQLSLNDEKRLAAMCHGQLYQKRVARAYNKKVRPRKFEVGQQVLKRILPHQVEAKALFNQVRKDFKAYYQLPNCTKQSAAKAYQRYHDVKWEIRGKKIRFVSEKPSVKKASTRQASTWRARENNTSFENRKQSKIKQSGTHPEKQGRTIKMKRSSSNQAPTWRNKVRQCKGKAVARGSSSSSAFRNPPREQGKTNQVSRNTVKVLAIRRPPRKQGNTVKSFSNLAPSWRTKEYGSNVVNQEPTWRTKGKSIQVSVIRSPHGNEGKSNSSVGNQEPTWRTKVKAIQVLVIRSPHGEQRKK